KSTDGGWTWKNKTSSFHAGGASDVVLDPSHPSVLYAGLVRNGNGVSDTAGVYKSVDGGVSWALMDLPPGLPPGDAPRLGMAPAAPGTVYATEFVLTIDGSNSPLRFRTTDAGKSWRELAATPGDIETRSWHVVLAVDPKNADHVFANDAYVLYESK